MNAVDRFLARCNPRHGRTLVCGSKIHEGTNKEDRRDLYADPFGVDMLEGEGVDLVHDLEEPLPLYMSFEHVDCVSTLEHVRRPWLFAQNVENAMIEGATILVMVPWVWRLHGYPDDYFRYTPSGIASLFPSIEWQAQTYIVEDEERKRVPRLQAAGKRWLARSELAMFGRKCNSIS